MKKIIGQVLMVVAVMMLLSLTVHAEGSKSDQINAVCAAALLFMAGAGENVNANTAAAMTYMKRVPAMYHPAIDVVIREWGKVPRAEARKAARNCRDAL